MLPASCAAPVSIVEHMQEQLASLRQQVDRPGPLSIGSRAQAGTEIRVLTVTLGNLKRTLRRPAVDNA